MGLTLTLVILGVALLAGIFANVQSRRPPDPTKPRMLPYLGIQFCAILVVILMTAHLITLLTGKPFVGRMG